MPINCFYIYCILRPVPEDNFVLIHSLNSLLGCRSTHYFFVVGIFLANRGKLFFFKKKKEAIVTSQSHQYWFYQSLSCSSHTMLIYLQFGHTSSLLEASRCNVDSIDGTLILLDPELGFPSAVIPAQVMHLCQISITLSRSLMWPCAVRSFTKH